MKGEYNGQTKAEYTKNYRSGFYFSSYVVKDMLSKAPGDEDAQIRLAQKQAYLIKDEWKAINRAIAAKDLGQPHIFDVFFRRAYELGSVGKQEYRDYQLQKLGL